MGTVEEELDNLVIIYADLDIDPEKGIYTESNLDKGKEVVGMTIEEFYLGIRKKLGTEYKGFISKVLKEMETENK